MSLAIVSDLIIFFISSFSSWSLYSWTRSRGCSFYSSAFYYSIDSIIYVGNYSRGFGGLSISSTIRLRLDDLGVIVTVSPYLLSSISTMLCIRSSCTGGREEANDSSFAINPVCSLLNSFLSTNEPIRDLLRFLVFTSNSYYRSSSTFPSAPRLFPLGMSFEVEEARLLNSSWSLINLKCLI